MSAVAHLSPFNIRPGEVEDAKEYYPQAGEYAYCGDSLF